MTGRARRRICRCCGDPAESSYCCPCGARHVKHARVVLFIIRALWGSAGVAQYQTALAARRLAARRTPTRRAAP